MSADADDLDPETFEEEKFVEYFPKLQTAYKRAFNQVNERQDSELVHAVDQQILNESEPHYEGDGEFSIELPENPTDRVTVAASDERIEDLLAVHTEAIRHQLRVAFGFESED